MIESIDLSGQMLGDMRVLSDVIENLPHLKFLTICASLLPSYFVLGPNQEDRDQPLTVPIGDKLNHLSLDSHSSLLFVQKVAPINMRHLRISGQLLVEFDLSFPQLLFSRGIAHGISWHLTRFSQV